MINIRVKARAFSLSLSQTQNSTPGFKLNPGLLQNLLPRHVQGATLCTGVRVCVRVSMLNISHCNRQGSDITNCTESSGREAVGREYTENDLSITLLMAVPDRGAGVVVGAHGASANASTIAMCETHSDGGLLGPEAGIWPRSAVSWLSRAVQLGLAVSELQSERRELRTWRRPRPTCSPLLASLLPLRHCRTSCKPQTRQCHGVDRRSWVFRGPCTSAGVDTGSAQGRHRRRPSARQLTTESTVVRPARSAVPSRPE